ncbi:MAG TPA: hypothetical protein VM055_03110 [Novosphingobium sp.]|nr:hypothetical protein [Novosphingobium sp.]
MNASRQHRFAKRKTLAPLLAGGALALGLLVHPAIGNAFSSGFDSLPVSLAARGGIGSFTPASVDPRMAARISIGSLNHGQLFRFTPAAGRSGQRAVTVAVRVDAESARAVSVRQTLAAASVQPGLAAVRVAPTAFNLGIARGYESFAPKLAKTVVTPEIKRIDMPDLAAFKPGRGADRLDKGPARFAPRIALDESAKPGRAPRTLEGQGDYSVDVGGSYRVTRSVAVTAGVRYSSERDRVRPLTDAAQDNQAVYVGTQFRF